MLLIQGINKYPESSPYLYAADLTTKFGAQCTYYLRAPSESQNLTGEGH